MFKNEGGDMIVTVGDDRGVFVAIGMYKVAKVFLHPIPEQPSAPPA